MNTNKHSVKHVSKHSSRKSHVSSSKRSKGTSTIESYWRPLSDKERTGVEAMQKKLQGTDWSKEQHDITQLLRFLKARDYDHDKSFTMILEYFNWHDTFKPERIRLGDVKNILKEGKVIVLPPDNLGRPTILINPSLHIPGQYTPEEVMRVGHYIVNKCIEQMPEDQHQLLIIWDRRGSSRKNFDNKLVGLVTQSFEKYYPERIGDILILGANWLFHVLFKITKMVMPAATLQKIKLLGSDVHEELLKYTSNDGLPVHLGGTFQIPEVYGGVKIEKKPQKKLAKTKHHSKKRSHRLRSSSTPESESSIAETMTLRKST
mmetsp:Transcript_4426/g.4850  ORF Transcript_4426/g.4850 Transcript_4426/m.4850 type:complete len:318 (-) Transcript_4426:45-998(-)